MACLSWRVHVHLGPFVIHTAAVMVVLDLLFCRCSRPSTGNVLSGLPGAMRPALVAACLLVLVLFLKRNLRSSLTVVIALLG